ncbi:AraC family transcriptional regulator [Neptuniibacter sp. QD37_6]|uniref:AraC family transcriptional regulator n=1 Tax=Neptuniibacter sp. QD37_6 TaxID=3398210 RepID=UPI0039F47F61
MDSLSAILNTFRLEAEIIQSAQYCGDWAIKTSGQGHVTFHFVTQGCCYLDADCFDAPLLMNAGDFILFPRDANHKLESSPECGIPVNSVKSLSYSEGLQLESAGLLCGYFCFSHAASNPLLQSLPEYIYYQAGSSENGAAIQGLLDVIKAEVIENGSGHTIVINRLTESLFALLLRAYINRAREMPLATGLAAALADSRISRALDAIHSNPEINWSVHELAEVAAMSRSAFADRFKVLLQEPPKTYLIRWRMQNAWIWLKEEGATTIDVANRCGYESEAAFSKAFKKVTGQTPGSVRNQ